MARRMVETSVVSGCLSISDPGDLLLPRASATLLRLQAHPGMLLRRYRSAGALNLRYCYQVIFSLSLSSMLYADAAEARHIKKKASC